MLKQIKKRTEGFTIIEVLIVLAIAGLILLIVFLAVPALQRNQRNTTRKDEVARLGGAVTEFVSNSNGTMPVASTANTANSDAAKILASAGKITSYAANKIVIVNNTASAALTVTPSQLDTVRINTGAKCGAAGATTKTGASTNSVSIQYMNETNGTLQAACQDI